MLYKLKYFGIKSTLVYFVEQGRLGLWSNIYSTDYESYQKKKIVQRLLWLFEENKHMLIYTGPGSRLQSVASWLVGCELTSLLCHFCRTVWKCTAKVLTLLALISFVYEFYSMTWKYILCHSFWSGSFNREHWFGLLTTLAWYLYLLTELFIKLPSNYNHIAPLIKTFFYVTWYRLHKSLMYRT